MNNFTLLLISTARHTKRVIIWNTFSTINVKLWNIFRFKMYIKMRFVVLFAVFCKVMQRNICVRFSIWRDECDNEWVVVIFVYQFCTAFALMDCSERANDSNFSYVSLYMNFTSFICHTNALHFTYNCKCDHKNSFLRSYFIVYFALQFPHIKWNSMFDLRCNLVS